MELVNTFEVPVPPDQAWRLLLDVERIAPCMPGAELTEVVDETTWKGKVTVKLGAVSLSYRGAISMTERDDEARRAVLEAQATEARGKGTASATVTSGLEGLDGGGTRIVITTDLKLSGQAAQMGRGMIADVSQRMTDQFAECIRQQLQTAEGDGETEAGEGGEAAPAAQAKPIGGIRLGLWALWRALVRGLRRAAARVSGRRGS